MSIPDSAVHGYFQMATELKPWEINKIMAAMHEGGLHPRDAKMRLAREIVSIRSKHADRRTRDPADREAEISPHYLSTKV